LWKGLKMGGGHMVLSTIRGRPCRCATSAMAGMSSTLPLGFPTDSVYKKRVSSSMARSKLTGSAESTKRASMPKRRRG